MQTSIKHFVGREGEFRGVLNSDKELYKVTLTRKVGSLVAGVSPEWQFPDVPYSVSSMVKLFIKRQHTPGTCAQTWRLWF